jgi:hypothetical protein
MKIWIELTKERLILKRSSGLEQTFYPQENAIDTISLKKLTSFLLTSFLMVRIQQTPMAAASMTTKPTMNFIFMRYLKVAKT